MHRPTEPHVPGWLVAVLAIILAWSLVPLGSNRPWSWDLLAALLIVPGVAAVFTGCLPPRARRMPPALVLSAWLYAACIAYALVQAWLPVDAPYAHPVFTALPLVDAQPRLSAAPADTLDGAIRLSLYGLGFALGMACGVSLSARERLVHLMLLAVTVVALYGIWRLFARELTVFGYYQTQGAVVTGTLANRNHAATLFNISLMMALAWLASLARTAEPRRDGWLRRLLDHIERRRGLLIMAAVLAVASLLTASKGGFLALACGLITLFALGEGATSWRRIGLAVVVTASSLALATWLFGVRLIQRMSVLLQDPVGQTVADDEGRWQAWLVTLEAIGDRPWLGHGLGTYAEQFLAYRPEGFEAKYFHAHNVYLELALELGLPAAALLVLAVALVLLWLLRAFTRCDGDARFVARGVLAAGVVVAVHSLVDFSLQIPAVSLFFAVLLGMACGACLKSLATAQPH